MFFYPPPTNLQLKVIHACNYPELFTKHLKAHRQIPKNCVSKSMCQEEKIVSTRLRNSCLITFSKKKKIQKQSPELKKQSPEGFCKKGVLKNFANFTEKQ